MRVYSMLCVRVYIIRMQLYGTTLTNVAKYMLVCAQNNILSVLVLILWIGMSTLVVQFKLETNVSYPPPPPSTPDVQNKMADTRCDGALFTLSFFLWGWGEGVERAISSEEKKLLRFWRSIVALPCRDLLACMKLIRSRSYRMIRFEAECYSKSLLDW